MVVTDWAGAQFGPRLVTGLVAEFDQSLNAGTPSVTGGSRLFESDILRMVLNLIRREGPNQRIFRASRSASLRDA